MGDEYEKRARELLAAYYPVEPIDIDATPLPVALTALLRTVARETEARTIERCAGVLDQRSDEWTQRALNAHHGDQHREAMTSACEATDCADAIRSLRSLLPTEDGE